MSVPNEDTGMGDTIISLITLEDKIVIGCPAVKEDTTTRGTDSVKYTPGCADLLTETKVNPKDGDVAKKGDATVAALGNVQNASIGECIVSNPTQCSIGTVMCIYVLAVEAVGMNVKTIDMCKIIFGSCASEKHVACAGGGINYCPNSVDGASTKDNYTVALGGTKNVAKNVCVATLYMSKTEAEAEIKEQSVEVSDVGVDTTTSDNTLNDSTCERAGTAVGCVSAEVSGNTGEKSPCEAVEIGADTTLTGVSMYMAKVVDTSPKPQTLQLKWTPVWKRGASTGTTNASDKYIVNSTVVGEAAECLVLVAKETSENRVDVGVSVAIAETKDGGMLPACTIDNGRGTVCEDALKVTPCYVISKTKIGSDSEVTGMSGPCGEVSVVTVVASVA